MEGVGVELEGRTEFEVTAGCGIHSSLPFRT